MLFPGRAWSPKVIGAAQRYRGSIGVLFVTLGSRGLALGALVATARSLSARGFGEVVTLLSVIGLAGLIADFGTSEWMVQQAVRHGLSPEGSLGSRLTLALIMGVVVLAIGCAVSGRPGTPLLATSASIPILAVLVNVVVLERSSGRSVRSAAWSSATPLVPASGAALGAMWRHTPAASLVGVLSLSAAAAMLGAVLSREWSPPGSLRRSLSLAWSARYLAVASICVALYSRGDRLVLAAIAGADAVGPYAAFYTLVFGFSVIGPSLAWAAMPALAAIREPAQWRDAAVARIKVAVAAGVLAGTAFVLVSRPAISMIFGVEYEMGWVSVLSFGLLTALYVVNPVVTAAVISIGRQSFVSRVAVANTCLAAVIFPAAAYVGGATGMVIASLLIELFGGVHLVLLGGVLRSERDHGVAKYV